MVTSDKGLAGSVNSAVLKKVEKLRASGVEFDMIAIGRKAVEFAGREKITLLGEYTNVGDDVTVADVYEVATKAVNAFASDATYAKVGSHLPKLSFDFRARGNYASGSST
ncbi:MAG: F0F1 ATP synthase subunit gamma [Candidatus Paceibacterota bacterium]